MSEELRALLVALADWLYSITDEPETPFDGVPVFDFEDAFDNDG